MTHYRIHALLIIFSILSLADTGAAKPDTAARLALLTGPSSELSRSPLLALLENQLSQTEHIQLLERAEIGSLLREQQLNLSGRYAAPDLVRVGRLLRADACVILTLEEAAAPTKAPQRTSGGPLVRIRIVETERGVRLWESYLSYAAEDLERSIQTLAETIRNRVTKLNQPAGQVIPLGIVDIHRVQLGDHYNRLSAALPGLLSARLAHEPNLLTLEREDLGLIFQEKQRTEGDSNPFWNAALLMEGTLEPGREHTLQLKLHVRQTAEDKPMHFTVPLDPNNPMPGVDRLAREISQSLLNSPLSPQWQPEQEAQTYYRQGAMLMKHRRFAQAIAPLETAHALSPDKVPYTGLYFQSLWCHYSESQGKTERCTDLDLAEQASFFVRQLRDRYQAGQVTAQDLFDAQQCPLWVGYQSMWISAGNNYFHTHVSVCTDQIREINRTNRKIWYHVYEQAVRDVRQLYFPDSIRIQIALTYSHEPQEVIDLIKTMVNRLILPTEQGGRVPDKRSRERFCGRMITFYRPFLDEGAFHSSHFLDKETEFQDLVHNYLLELVENTDPLVHFYAALRLADHWNRLPAPTQEAREEAKARSVEYMNQAISVYLEALTVQDPEAGITESDYRYGAAISHSLNRFLSSNWAYEPEDLHLIYKHIVTTFINRREPFSLACFDPERYDGKRWISFLQENTSLAHTALRLLQQTSEEPQRKASFEVQVCQAAFERLQKNLPLQPAAPGSKSYRCEILTEEGQWTTPSDIWNNSVRWIFRDPYLYIAGVSTDKPLTLIRLDLAQTSPPRSWKNEYQAAQVFLNSGIAVQNGKIYIPLYGLGIAVFPDTEEASDPISFHSSMLTQKHNLPTTDISGLAGDGSRLWITYGRMNQENGLGCYEPEKQKWQTHISSLLKDSAPFASALAHSTGMSHLTFIAPNHLYFKFVRIRESQYSGLWCYDTHSQALTAFGVFAGNPDGNLLAQGRTLWCRGKYILLTQDTRTEPPTYVIGKSRRPGTAYTYPPRPQGPPRLKSKAGFFIPQASMDSISFGKEGLDLAASTIHRDQLWARYKGNRVAILKKDRPFAEATLIPNDILKGEEAFEFISTPYGLVAIGTQSIGLLTTD